MIDGKYHVLKQLDTGTFGDVYQIREKSSGNLLAAKVEILNPKKSVKVERELLFMDALKQSKFVPTVYDTHKIRYDHYIKKRDKNDNEIEDETPKEAIKVKATVLIMDLLGPNLHDLLDQNTGMFDIEVCSVLGLKMVKGIRDIHEKGLVHRDIKPINFCIEHGCVDPTNAGIFIIDFGLSRLYRD